MKRLKKRTDKDVRPTFMKLLTPKISEVLPTWNKRIHTEDEAYNFCDRNKIITLDSENISDLGEYRIRHGRSVIILHKFIQNRYRNWVIHHEIGHFILHPTTCARFSDQVQKRKIEQEANFFAAVALIPKKILEAKTLAEIADEFNYPLKIILFRKQIYDTYRI